MRFFFKIHNLDTNKKLNTIFFRFPKIYNLLDKKKKYVKITITNFKYNLDNLLYIVNYLLLCINNFIILLI
jgi:hypothetical protein